MKVEVKELKMTKSVIKQIIELDKLFYTDFDYNDTSWYYTRYSNKNKTTVLIVNSAIVGYYVLYKISKKLLKDILDLKYSGDYDFPESELNKSRGATYISSLLIKPEFRKYSISLLRQLYNDVKKIKEICAIAVSPIGKRLSKKIMDCVGNIKNSEVYYKNN